MMYIMMSWKIGERPHLDFLPVGTPDTFLRLLRVILQAARAGREIEVYLADDDKLPLIYPDADNAMVSAELVSKQD